jgi:hypothetical protein
MRKQAIKANRRFALQAGALWGAGLTLPDVLNWQAPARAAGKTAATANAVILLYMTGGPAQQETFDMKPDAGDGYRGEFQPIATNVPGLQICELLPTMAKTAQRYSVVRSVWHESNDHGIGAHSNLTGIDLAQKRNTDAKATRQYSPCFGSVVQHLAGGRNSLPGAVQLPNRIGDQNAFQWPGQTGGYLGSQDDPLMLIDESWKPGTALPNFSLPDDVTPKRLASRARLLDRQRASDLESTAATRNFSRFQQQAADILSSPTAWSAFDIDRERPQTIARYGDNRFGRSVLVARRLVEAGVRVVTVTWMLNHSTENFDTHLNHFKLMKELLLPPVDRAFSALLADLDERGLLDSTLVAWTGEFGRTPKINHNAGRDHWSPVYSTVLAGGGVQGGRVIGRTDKVAGEPTDDPHHVSDFFATMYHALGYRAATRVRDVANRPHFIVQGQAIQELL